MKYALISLVLFLASCVSQPYPPDPAPSPNPTPGLQTGEYCGGFRQAPAHSCANPDDFCRRTIGDLCGAADAPGICTPRPEMCTRDYRPVCGCDDRTYSNECTANSQGVSAAYAGECRP